MKTQKTIGIFAPKHPNLPRWDPDILKSGITGSEEAVIYIAEELVRLGYKVFVFGEPPANSPYRRNESNPQFLDIKSPYPFNSKLDIAICWRTPEFGLHLKAVANRIYFWPHDTASPYCTQQQLTAFDGILWISKWQKENWSQVHPCCAKFQSIFGNGLNPDSFPIRQAEINPYSCIYGSNYARGLEILLNIWPCVKAEFPQATLDIYYGWQHYGLLSQELESSMRKKAKELPGVIEHGRVGHEELNAAYSRASLWTYPCIAQETFCITGLRAQFAGAIPVILEGSALSETVLHGYKCTRAEDYLPLLLQALHKAPEIRLEERAKMKEFILEKFTWKKIAGEWETLFD